jgi:mRNA interferase RelE/StbE
MSYQVILFRVAIEQLNKLGQRDHEAVLAALRLLEKEPRPSGVKKLEGYDLWRTRIGDFRVIYSIDDTSSKITVRKIARRNEGTYKRL